MSTRSAFAAHTRRSFLGMSGAAGLAALAACGSNTGRGGSDDPIQQWYHAYSEPGVREAVERFAATYTPHEVQVQWNQGDYDSTLSKALLNGTVPDVYEAETKIDRVRAGQAVPLDDVIAATKNDFTPSVLAGHTVDGKVYAIPQAVDTQVLFYRKSLLDSAGVQPPKTVPELIEATKALSKGDTKGLFLGNDGGASVMLGPILWSVGLDFLSGEGEEMKIGFDDPAFVDAANSLKALNTGGGLRLGARKDWSEPDAFTSGSVAMQWCGLWAVPAVTKKYGDDFGVLPWPTLAAPGKPTVPVGSFGATVNGKSTKVDASKQFVRWLWTQHPDLELEFAVRYGYHIPARISLIRKAKALNSGPAKDIVSYVVHSSKLVGGPNWTSKMNTAYSDALSRIVKENGDPAAELKGVATAVNGELDRLFRS